MSISAKPAAAELHCHSLKRESLDYNVKMLYVGLFGLYTEGDMKKIAL